MLAYAELIGSVKTGGDTKQNFIWQDNEDDGEKKIKP